MKKIVMGCLLLLATATSFSQEWLTSFDEAKKQASKEHKPIILVFQGSDWCAPCMKLDQEIWSTEAFKAYAKDHYVMLKADFPKKKKNALSTELQAHNNKLAESYNQNGYFPYVVVLDAQGNIKGSTGYKKSSPETYIKLLDSF